MRKIGYERILVFADLPGDFISRAGLALDQKQLTINGTLADEFSREESYW